MLDKIMFIYVVYDHPKDYPNHWVVKRDCISDGKVNRDPFYILVRNTLDGIKLHFEAKGLSFLARHPEDDPVIYGTYL